MSRDYRNPSTTRKKPSRQTQRRPAQSSAHKARGFTQFLAGSAVGALLTALILVPQLGRDSGSVNDADAVRNTPPSQASKPRFDFYKSLGENEVIVPENKPEKAAPRQNLKPVPQSIYLLQVGSFRNANEADGLRAKLLMMNFEAKIDSIKSNAGTVWHRVIVGPYTERGSMTKARDKLASNGMNVLLLKRNK